MMNGREPSILYQYFNKEQKGWELETVVYKDFEYKIGFTINPPATEVFVQ